VPGTYPDNYPVGQIRAKDVTILGLAIWFCGEM